MDKLEATLVQKGNEDYITLMFSRPFTNHSLRIGFFSDEKETPKKFLRLKKRLEFLSHGCSVDIETASITFNGEGAAWNYFMPKVVAYLRRWWKEDFQIRYVDQRDEYQRIGEDADGYGGKTVKVDLKFIDYGLDFVGDVRPPMRPNTSLAPTDRIQKGDQILTRECFLKHVAESFFTDYDGFALAADMIANCTYGDKILPSETKDYLLSEDITHVVWYNR
jgi:hypothetical protein